MGVDYDDEIFRRVTEWGHSYDGYSRLADGPSNLESVLEPARREYMRSVRIPTWCGVDLLRGWAFYLLRQDYFAGGDSLGDEWIAVLETLRKHPKATPEDLPPAEA